MRWMVAVVLLAGGCGQYTEAQMRLAEQARRGMELCRQAYEERGQLVERLYEADRARLDAAFDADVRAREALAADWVIEHRKAYAAALDALQRRTLAGTEAGAAARRNFEAAEAALNRLKAMQAAQLRIAGLEELLGGGIKSEP